MELRIFQSGKGDCLLLTSADGRRILCDGGTYGAMRDWVAEELAKLRAPPPRTGKPPPDIDYAYVSHIDQDHIAGVLRLLRDELDWRAFDYARKHDGSAREPEMPRPPRIGGLWHNAFGEQVEDNLTPITDLLVASESTLAMAHAPEAASLVAAFRTIATSIPEALELSGLASADLLGIPINRLPGRTRPAKLLMVRKGARPFAVGTMRLTIVGPTAEELDDLRAGWNSWAEDADASIDRLHRRMRRALEKTGGDRKGEGGGGIATGDFFGVPSFKGVTTPNIASLMFMVEEDGKRLLLTGDAQHDRILAGLERTGFLRAKGLHLDVLKVQHHGSEFNYSAAFAHRVTADHYVFCGNGEHDNPDLRVLDMVAAAHASDDPAVRGIARQARDSDRPFHFWFSTSAATNRSTGGRDHWRKVEAHAAALVARLGGRLATHFNDQASITLAI